MFLCVIKYIFSPNVCGTVTEGTWDNYWHGRDGDLLACICTRCIIYCAIYGADHSQSQ